MVPVLAGTGTSFYGAFLYYCHDRNARTRKRIAWTQTLNLLTDCVDKAWKVMAYTAKHQQALKRATGQRATGAKLQKPVLSYSLAWHPEQSPTKEEMQRAAVISLEYLGLSEHEAMIVSHRDQAHPHLHVIVNVAHPLTGLVAKLKFTKRKLSDFARDYQRKEGSMYCPKREGNHDKRQAGMKTRYVDPAIETSWENASCGQVFADNLKTHGYQLVRGRKRLLVITAHGKTVNPLRHLNGVKASEFRERMADVETDKLPTAEALLSGDIDTSNPSAEEASAHARHELELKQRDEVASLSADYWHQISCKRDELNRLYDLEARESDINRLTENLKQSGFLHKIIGLKRHWKKKLEAQILIQGVCKQRIREAVGQLKAERDHSIEKLRLRHEQELRPFLRQPKAATAELMPIQAHPPPKTSP